jgi:hypothetical protein
MTLSFLEARLSGAGDTLTGYEQRRAFLWIKSHPADFMQLLQESQRTLEDFFEDFLEKGANFLQALIGNESLMASLGDERRNAFISRAVSNLKLPGHRWLRVAIKLGVPRQLISQLILQKVEVSLTNGQRLFIVHDFLVIGYPGTIDYVEQSYDELNYWSVLTNDELIQAMSLIADHAPQLFFVRNVEIGMMPTSISGRLKTRLERDKVEQLVLRAADHLSSPRHISTEELCMLPIETQVQLARRFRKANLELSLEWVGRMAITLGRKRGCELIQELADQLVIDDALQYALWITICDIGNADPVVKAVLKAHIKTALSARGIEIAQLQRETHRRKPQYYVRCNGVTYIAHRRHTDFFPQVGRMVVFRPQEAKQLAPNVRAVRFEQLYVNQ